MGIPTFPLHSSHRIILLQSHNIHRNLAFESVLHSDSTRFNRASERCNGPTDILLWRSHPCVVIGRFQNAWRECNTGLLKELRWPLARRESGGGAVFHDLGNLNISFMQPHSVLDRRKCMEFLRDVLRDKTGQAVSVGKRFDLWTSSSGAICDPDKSVNPRKISGASSRLGPKVSYHHCTLLCNANLDNLTGVLTPTFRTLQTKATASVRSSVTNIGVDIIEIQDHLVQSAIHWLRKCYPSRDNPIVVPVAEGAETQYVNAEGFSAKLSELQSWSWVYGASPRFELDLNEFEDGLSPVGQVKLLVDRGGRVSSLEVENTEEASVADFVRRLSDTLCGAECRPFLFNGILDRFEADWYLNNVGEMNHIEHLMIQALRILSEKF